MSEAYTSDGKSHSTVVLVGDSGLPLASDKGLAINNLSQPTTPYVIATGAASVSQALTASCKRVSMYATQGTWYAINATASSTSHYIASGERLDIAVPANTTMSFLQETAAGSIRITELS